MKAVTCIYSCWGVIKTKQPSPPKPVNTIYNFSVVLKMVMFMGWYSYDF